MVRASNPGLLVLLFFAAVAWSDPNTCKVAKTCGECVTNPGEEFSDYVPAFFNFGYLMLSCALVRHYSLLAPLNMVGHKHLVLERC